MPKVEEILVTWSGGKDWATTGSVQGLVLAPCSGITYWWALETFYGAGDQTKMAVNNVSSLPTVLFLEPLVPFLSVYP